MVPKLLFQRLAVNELHPHANLSTYALRAVDRDDVGVTNSGQQPSFLNDRRDAHFVITFSAPQNLERDLAIETAVPGSINIAKGSASDVLDDSERTPGIDRRAGLRRCSRWFRARSGSQLSSRRPRSRRTWRVPCPR